MLSGISAATSPSSSQNQAQSSPSPSRHSRLRGLSYLRGYSSSSNSSPPRSESPASAHLAAQDSARDRTPYASTRTTSGASTATVGPSTPTATTSRPRIAARRDREEGASAASTAGWLPYVDASATTTRLEPSEAISRSSRQSSTELAQPYDMARSRSATSPHNVSATTTQTVNGQDWPSVRLALRRNVSGPPIPTQHPSSPGHSSQLPSATLPSIRFVPYQDPRSPRPSLNFVTTTRTLPNQESIIRVGRYSEKDAHPPAGSSDVVSDAPIGFKSKVVSRRHCEFFYKDNQWFIKDVKSSSGTFLNHIRLSPPGEESRHYAVKDGDLVQLGIDFKGGEEMIFRCVKIRILCNRGWQKGLNKFNKSAHKQLHELQRSTSNGGEAAHKPSTECTICLNSIAPCQSLFVAPCSHTWHFKCIRPMLDDVRRTRSNESHFTCPNCRNIADLDADVDEAPVWEESDAESALPDDASVSSPSKHATSIVGNSRKLSSQSAIAAAAAVRAAAEAREALEATADVSSTEEFFGSPSGPAGGFVYRNRSSTPENLSDDGSYRTDTNSGGGSDAENRTAPAVANLDFDGPMTPRNNFGPFVFDGLPRNGVSALRVTDSQGSSSSVDAVGLEHPSSVKRIADHDDSTIAFSP